MLQPGRRGPGRRRRPALAGHHRRSAGAEVTVFDPDLDPDGRYAALLTGILADGLEHLGRDYPR